MILRLSGLSGACTIKLITAVITMLPSKLECLSKQVESEKITKTLAYFALELIMVLISLMIQASRVDIVKAMALVFASDKH